MPIQLVINGEDTSLESITTVSNLIEYLDLEHGKLAIEINQEIVPRSQFDTYCLADGDVIEIIQAIGGG